MIYTMGSPATPTPAPGTNQRIVMLKSSTGGLQAVTPAILEALKKQGVNVGALKGTIVMPQSSAGGHTQSISLTSLLAKTAATATTTTVAATSEPEATHGSEASKAAADLMSSMQEDAVPSAPAAIQFQTVPTTSHTQLLTSTPTSIHFQTSTPPTSVHFQAVPSTAHTQLLTSTPATTLQFQTVPSAAQFQTTSATGVTSLLSQGSSGLMLPGHILTSSSSSSALGVDPAGKARSLLSTVLTSAEGPRPMVVKPVSTSPGKMTLGAHGSMFRIMSSGGKAVQVCYRCLVFMIIVQIHLPCL